VADIAMGSGRDAVFLAEKGFFVTGLERSAEAVGIAKKSMETKGVCVWPVLGDAKHLPFRKNSLDGIVVFYFLIREIMEELNAPLKKGGILIYETFLKRQNAIDRQRNPERLLDDGELFGYFDNLELLFYEETIEGVGDRKRALARAVGRKR
jgi:ubiquinone/menaquinone biosynthesis C-methylase UbiE